MRTDRPLMALLGWGTGAGTRLGRFTATRGGAGGTEINDGVWVRQ